MVKIYQNFIFLSNFKFLIPSVIIFNTKIFCEHKLIKKHWQKSENSHRGQRLNKWKSYLLLYFLISWKNIPSAHYKMGSHCMMIELTILIPVIINFLTIFSNNKKVSVLWAFFFFFFFFCPLFVGICTFTENFNLRLYINKHFTKWNLFT